MRFNLTLLIHYSLPFFTYISPISFIHLLLPSSFLIHHTVNLSKSCFYNNFFIPNNISFFLHNYNFQNQKFFIFCLLTFLHIFHNFSLEFLYNFEYTSSIYFHRYRFTLTNENTGGLHYEIYSRLVLSHFFLSIKTI